MVFPDHRGRRLRKHNSIRESIAETNICVQNLVMPYFIDESNKISSIDSMEGIKRFTEESVISEIGELLDLGVKMVALFPVISPQKKSKNADESLNEDNLICRLNRKLKKEFPELIIICDVALDAYTLSGHDGLVDSLGKIDNDKTIEMLSKMALNFAKSGADIVAPSDMMDGRIKLIRSYLEKNKYHDTCILSYSSKFCSNFYSPFRQALGSEKNLGNSSKSTYQIDFRNRREAIKESLEDIEEGADIIMVKPAGYYLDIVREIKDLTVIPIAAYQVSGEYAMIKNAVSNGIFDLRSIVLESICCIKRSGADIIFSYFAKEVAKWLR